MITQQVIQSILIGKESFICFKLFTLFYLVLNMFSVSFYM